MAPAIQEFSFLSLRLPGEGKSCREARVEMLAPPSTMRFRASTSHEKPTDSAASCSDWRRPWSPAGGIRRAMRKKSPASFPTARTTLFVDGVGVGIGGVSVVVGVLLLLWWWLVLVLLKFFTASNGVAGGSERAGGAGSSTIYWMFYKDVDTGGTGWRDDDSRR